MVYVSPPDQTIWWDSAAVVGAVLNRLRLQDGDVDQPRITELVDVAGEMINDYLDQCSDRRPTAARKNAIVALTVELYGRREVPIMGAGGGTRLERVDTDVQNDRIADILATLGPRKERFGVA